MRRVITVIVLSGLAVVATVHGGHHAAAQTVTGPIQQSNQLQLPVSAFPADYTASGDEAWTPSNADGSSFSRMHSTSYTSLGMLGAWYQYYAKPVTATSGNVILVSPVEVAYLGTYYPGAAAAQAAYSDIQPGSSLSNPQACSYGTHCVTYTVSLPWNGLTYTGLVRIIQLANAVAEIRTDIVDVLSSHVSTAQFNSNLDGVSQAFVQDLNTLSPTSTPVPPTATPTTAPTNTPTITPSPTATSTPTAIPLNFEVAAVRVERYGSKADPALVRPPIKSVKAGTKVYLSIYTHVLSAPPGTVGTVDFRLILAGRSVLHHITQVDFSSSGMQRSVVTFTPTKPGSYRLRGIVSAGGNGKQHSGTFSVVR